MTKIRMERIGRIASEISQAKVEIHLTTELRSLVAFLSDGDGKFDILVNANLCKTEPGIVAAVAHEATHIITKSSEHDNIFRESMIEVCNRFEDEMGYPSGTLSSELKALGEGEYY